MSFIDWADPEEMLGLLVEYVTDEQLAEHDDPRRARFLRELTTALLPLASQAPELSPGAMVDRLRAIFDSQPSEFSSDPALVHLDDCIEELIRIVAQDGAPLE